MDILIHEHDGFPMIDRSEMMNVFMTRITLKPDELCISFHDDRPIEHLKEMASRKLSQYIMDKLTYQRTKADIRERKRDIHTFSINDCTTSQRELYKIEVKNLRDDLESMHRALNSVTKEVERFKGETVVDYLKRWWKR